MNDIALTHKDIAHLIELLDHEAYDLEDDVQTVTQEEEHDIAQWLYEIEDLTDRLSNYSDLLHESTNCNCFQTAPPYRCITCEPLTSSSIPFTQSDTVTYPLPTTNYSPSITSDLNGWLRARRNR